MYTDIVPIAPKTLKVLKTWKVLNFNQVFLANLTAGEMSFFYKPTLGETGAICINY